MSNKSEATWHPYPGPELCRKLEQGINGDDQPPEARACMAHYRVNVCRKATRSSPCDWSERPEDIQAVQEYQRG